MEQRARFSSTEEKRPPLRHKRRVMEGDIVQDRQILQSLMQHLRALTPNELQGFLQQNKALVIGCMEDYATGNEAVSAFVPRFSRVMAERALVPLIKAFSSKWDLSGDVLHFVQTDLPTKYKADYSTICRNLAEKIKDVFSSKVGKAFLVDCYLGSTLVRNFTTDDYKKVYDPLKKLIGNDTALLHKLQGKVAEDYWTVASLKRGIV
jgi:hypothetical protein